GRPLPEDESANAVIVGTLKADAANGPNGALMSVSVDWIGDGPSLRQHDRAINPVRGGVLLTVLGSFAAERTAEWTAGRIIRANVALRRPARYLNPGVPDQERALARRGVALVGSVKSAALLEVLAPASFGDETAARARRFVRRAIGTSVG